MQKSNFKESQSRVIEDAKQLRAKLVEMKKKKEQQNSQAIRLQLSSIYTKKFEQFKQTIETNSEDQLTSLELARQLRITEITDVESRLKELMSRLQNQELNLKQKIQQLNSSYKDALIFISQEQARQFDELRAQKQNQLMQRVRNYKQSIDIE